MFWFWLLPNNFLLLTLLTFNNYGWIHTWNIIPNIVTSLLKVASHPAYVFVLFGLNLLCTAQVLRPTNTFCWLGVLVALYNLVRGYHCSKLTYYISTNVGLENPLTTPHPPMLFVSVLGILFTFAFTALSSRPHSLIYSPKLLG